VRRKPRAMRFSSPPSPDLERSLLRRGIGVLVAGRSRCQHCRRTPLVGERIHMYESGRLACELCRDVHDEAPVSSEIVRSSEAGHAVRLRAA
jgi:hypothetical protein